MEKYLEQILATEEEARKIEQDAHNRADKMIADARERSQEELRNAQEEAQKELSKLRAQAEQDAREQTAKLEEEYEHLKDGIQKRFAEREKLVMEGALRALDEVIARSGD